MSFFDLFHFGRFYWLLILYQVYQETCWSHYFYPFFYVIIFLTSSISILKISYTVHHSDEMIYLTLYVVSFSIRLSNILISYEKKFLYYNMFKYGLITAASFLFLFFLTFSFASLVENWHLFKKRNSEVNNLYSHRNFCKTFCVWFYVILVGSWARL